MSRPHVARARFACATAVAFSVQRWVRGLTAALAHRGRPPRLTFRTNPRAELFTNGAFSRRSLTIIWRHHLGKIGALVAPAGNFFGLGRICISVFISGPGNSRERESYSKFATLPFFSERRAIALGRLKTTFAPMGCRILRSYFTKSLGLAHFTRQFYRQNKVYASCTVLSIGEWSSAHFNSLAWRQALNGPRSWQRGSGGCWGVGCRCRVGGSVEDKIRTPQSCWRARYISL